MKRGREFFGFVVVLLALIANCLLVSAGAPINLHFENNISSSSDEGTFSVNWSWGGGTLSKNYSIYVSTDGGSSFIDKYFNTSALGYAFSTSNPATYTFRVGAYNEIHVEQNSSNTISITVSSSDTTGPSITLPTYTNGTAKKNTEQMTFNIAVSDSGSGTTGTACILNFNGANQTIGFSNGWCNSSTISLTGITDGVKILGIWANDTLNNIASSNSYYFYVDGASPTANATCNPSSIETGDAFPCSCSGTDATSGVNTTNATSTSGSTTSTSTEGTFTYTCNVTDYAGNYGTDTENYIVTLGDGTNTTTDTDTDTDTDTTTDTDTDTTDTGTDDDLDSNQTVDDIVGNQIGGSQHSAAFWITTFIILAAIAFGSLGLMKLIKKKIDTEEQQEEQMAAESAEYSSDNPQQNEDQKPK